MFSEGVGLASHVDNIDIVRKVKDETRFGYKAEILFKWSVLTLRVAY